MHIRVGVLVDSSFGVAVSVEMRFTVKKKPRDLFSNEVHVLNLILKPEYTKCILHHIVIDYFKSWVRFFIRQSNV